ncbi:MAG: PAS domain-containing sensor histidine kinase [Alphaproteobacteria bacterium]|nr:PAS domain-containing sensor histidine kinase [Alphaproteobacteria bacterium]
MSIRGSKTLDVQPDDQHDRPAVDPTDTPEDKAETEGGAQAERGIPPLLFVRSKANTGRQPGTAPNKKKSRNKPLDWAAVHRIATRADSTAGATDARRSEPNGRSDGGDSARRLRDFVRAGADWTWETDDGGILLHVSNGIAGLLQRPAAELAGMALFDLGHAPDLRGQPSLLELMKARRAFRDRAFEVRSADGRLYHCVLSGVPVFDDRSGRFAGYRGTGNDVSDRLETEREAKRLWQRLEHGLETIRNKNLRLELALNDATAASRAKNDFLAIVSHELRTPLNAIVGFTDIMDREMFGPVHNDRYREYIRHIAESAEHLLDIITDILDMSKIESGKLRVEDADISVRGVVESAWTLMADHANEKRVQFATILPPNLPRLQADKRIVRQMLLNLFSNGIKFTPAGGSINVGAGLQPNGTFAIRISDTGVGIDERDFDTVLTPFGQVQNTYRRTRDGTGLGLPLVKSMIEMHGGYLELQSERDVGTTVTLVFPADRVIRD